MNLGIKKSSPMGYVVLALTVFQGGLLVVQSFNPDTTWNQVLYMDNYLILAAIMLYVAVQGIAEHFLLLSYYLCYFIFLMGQKPFHWPEFYVYLTFVRCELSPREYVTFAAILWLGLTGPFFGYFRQHWRAGILAAAEKRKPMRYQRAIILNIARVGFFVTMPFALYMQLQVVLVKTAMGSYTAGYLVNVDIPVVVKVLNYFFTTFSLMYLAYRPQKTEAFSVLLSLLVIQGGIQMIQGRRALMASTLLFVVWYLLKYYHVKKLPRKVFWIMLGGGVGMMGLFFVVERFRSGGVVGGSSLLSIFRSFLTSTGGSDSVIGNTIQRKDLFPKPGVVYLFEPIVGNLRDNPIVANLLGIDRGVAQGAAYVAQHDSFSHWISYLTSNTLYSQGYGMGSSYLAEVYLAFGVTGVAVIAWFLGRLISLLSRTVLERNAIFKNMLVFFFVQKLFTLPRSGLFSWFGELVYLLIGMAVLLPFYTTERVSEEILLVKGTTCEE